MRRKFRCKTYKMTAVLALVAMVTWFLAMMQAESLESLLVEDEMKFELSIKRVALRNKFCKKSHPYNTSSLREGLGYRNFSRPVLLNNFKNPCFCRNVSMAAGSKHLEEKRIQLRCLPYFLIAGFPKSGTTDLWYRLLNHPDVKSDHVKEPMFFNKGMYKHPTFEAAAEEYIDFFANTAVRIRNVVSPASCHGPFPYHHIITGEGSVDTAYDNPDWKALPGNENCLEPVVTNADYIHQLNPNTKIIFMVRNPAERLYSDYIYESRYFGYDPSPKDFHNSVLGAINNFSQCAKQHSTRFCAYSNSLDTPKIRLRIGLYHIFLEDWLSVFDPNNILIVNADNTLGPRKLVTYREILKFLDIRPFTRQEEAGILNGRYINTRSKPERDIGDMLNETNKILNEFYGPFNKQLFKWKIV